MPAARGVIVVEQGSYEPVYWVITDPVTGGPIDLTAGYTVAAQVRDGGGVLLHAWTSAQLELTAGGRVYLKTPSVVSSAWSWRIGNYQIELTHPTGETVRIAKDRILVDPEIVR